MNPAAPFVDALAHQPLDVALAEILASAALASFDPVDDLIEALVASRDLSAVGLLAAMATIADPHTATAARGSFDALVNGGIDAPPWAAMAGTALAVEARLAEYRYGSALGVGWRHGDGTGHVMFAVVDEGGITEIRFLEGDSFDVIEQSPDLAHFTLTDVELDAAAGFLDELAVEPIAGDDRTWLNAPLARVRFATLGVSRPLRFRPPPERDDDDYSLPSMGIDLLRQRQTSWNGPLW